MKFNWLSPQKTKAQAMVEFAIVLPMLLLLLYGLLEAGRLLFIYSTIVTASRQAVRYGSATGIGTGTVPRYQDCAGIRAAAQRTDFLDAFGDEDILIQYDTGPGSTPTTFCTAGMAADASFIPLTTNNNRLLVNIEGDYLPIVPRIVGFLERSVANSNPIEAQSARTVLVSVSIQVTVPPSTWTASTPTATNTLTPTPTPTPTNTPTRTPTPTPVFTNTPSSTPTRTLTPTATSTATITRTPTSVASPVPVCNNISKGAITISGNTMSLTITNPNSWTLTVLDVFVKWNSDKGHQTGNDKTLQLLSASLGSQFWSGNNPGPSTTLNPVTPATIPPGTSTIVFTFDQSYDRPDDSEEILINFATPGCQNNPIHVTPQP